MKKVNGNAHIAHACPYCWLVLYSKGALTRYLNDEHWREIESEPSEESEASSSGQ